MTDNAGMTRPRIRVASYVIRNRAVPEVLVFDHIGMPEAGTQVTAGESNQAKNWKRRSFERSPRKPVY